MNVKETVERIRNMSIELRTDDERMIYAAYELGRIHGQVEEAHAARYDALVGQVERRNDHRALYRECCAEW